MTELNAVNDTITHLPKPSPVLQAHILAHMVAKYMLEKGQSSVTVTLDELIKTERSCIVALTSNYNQSGDIRCTVTLTPKTTENKS